MPRIRIKKFDNLNVSKIIACVVFFSFLIFIFIIFQPRKENKIILGNSEFSAILADTQELRIKGLSEKGNISSSEAMLFKFDEPARQCMWMKDMNFDIDILWLNQSKKVVHIKENITPQSYPESFCANDAKYVVEIRAGMVKEAGIKIGDLAKFR